jgi:hypothetical protein
MPRRVSPKSPRKHPLSRNALTDQQRNNLRSTIRYLKRVCRSWPRLGRIRRLCLAFSKKIANHKASVALNYVHYNFCHVVKTLRVTPAMQAGIADHVWDVSEFYDKIMNAPPSEPLVPKPLAYATPDGPSRELPNGRGFLRVVP